MGSRIISGYFRLRSKIIGYIRMKMDILLYENIRNSLKYYIITSAILRL